MRKHKKVVNEKSREETIRISRKFVKKLFGLWDRRYGRSRIRHSRGTEILNIFGAVPNSHEFWLRSTKPLPTQTLFLHHKAKILERRERALEPAAINHQANPSSEKNDAIDMFTLVPGDRVWFFDDATRDEDDPCTYRGILRSITKNGLCEIQPISNYLKQDPTTLRIRQSDVYRDLDRWTTRFGVGDQVVCMTGGKGWIAGTITHLWPIWDIKQDDIYFDIPCYKLISSVCGERFVVMVDTDYHVTKRPLTFRFQLLLYSTQLVYLT